MDALCPLVESSTDSAHDRLTLGAILRAFLREHQKVGGRAIE